MAIGGREIHDAALACGLIDRRSGSALPMAGTLTASEAVEAITLKSRLPAEALYRAVAQARGIPFLDLNQVRPSMTLIQRLPASLLRRSGILPITREGDATWVAVLDPDDRQSIEAVRRVMGRSVRIALAEPTVLLSALDRALVSPAVGTTITTQSAVDPVELLDTIFKEAYLRRASDIHLEPTATGMRVRVRVDGTLHEVLGEFTGAQCAALISRVKVLSELDIAEQRAPQDGGFNYDLPFAEGRSLDIRVATMPTEWGERATLRLLGADTQRLTLEALGMSPEDLKRFRKVIRDPYGLLLLTGPTGSGKTTTLYGALREINDPALNILTVEDPVEFRIPGISQVHVGGTDKVTFGSALRAFLRHDPDVLMVGEIRDAETADAAVKAAMTGHMVFSTLHTNYACGAISRLADIGCEPYRIGATLKGVVAQRLVRRLCVRCKETREATPEEAEFLNVEKAEIGMARGCAHCVGTGYKGRIGLFETLWIDKELSALISERATEEKILTAAEPKMSSFSDDARRKILDGIITIEEAYFATVMGD